MNPTSINYPDLPVSRHRETILKALRDHQVIVICGDTGSGKTTQLPKMCLEAGREAIGCTQPRRIAAVSVAGRVSEELKTKLGQTVGYQVRFDDRTSKNTLVKFMTDGILLAETQGDPKLKRYDTIIVDEAHERSLNIDFILGYLKNLLTERRDLKIIISSATIDAEGFSEFFDNAPVLQVEGRTYPVDLHYLPPRSSGEDLARQVRRAIEWIGESDSTGDVLVFLPGEREIRDVSEVLEGSRFAGTEILPLYGRLSIADQQRVFKEGGRRRVVLATNVAETSLTIPGIIYVVDSGTARMSRYNPKSQIQLLQTEPISQASARQRMGRCGRVTEGICVRLYNEEDYENRPPYTDPEIRRSSLAGVILQMKSLKLPEIDEFPFINPPAKKLVAEGYRTLKEIGALDEHKNLTDTGRKLSRFPLDPRLARMVVAAKNEGSLKDILVIVAGLSVQDPRERPSEKRQEADDAHAKWLDIRSDFDSLRHLWEAIDSFREKGRIKHNKLRKFCGPRFLNYRRVMEWDNIHRELTQLVRDTFKWKVEKNDADYDSIHKAILAGIPTQFGYFDPQKKQYKAGQGRIISIFPASGLFKKPPKWIMAFELVETSRLFARKAAWMNPEWLETVAPDLCSRTYAESYWDSKQGAVYAKENVSVAGIRIIEGRRMHFGRIDPEKAREVFIREALCTGEYRTDGEFMTYNQQAIEHVRYIEQKLRRVDGLFYEDGIFEFYRKRIPKNICTGKSFERWRNGVEKEDPHKLFMETQDIVYDVYEAPDEGSLPDYLEHAGVGYPLYYKCEEGARDDGICLECRIDQLGRFPDWLLDWVVPAYLEEKVTLLIRSLPKEARSSCSPVGESVRAFLAAHPVPDGPLVERLATFLSDRTRWPYEASWFDTERLPEYLVMKFWVCDEANEELAFGRHVASIRLELGTELEAAVTRMASSEWNATGQVEWTFGDLPETITAGSGTAWPALVDEGGTVGLKVCIDPLEAARSHRLGVLRLFRLRHADQMIYVEKHLPLGQDVQLILPYLGGDLEEVVAVAVDHAFGSETPRDQEAFEMQADAVRGEAFEAGNTVSRWLEAAVAGRAKVVDFLEEIREQRHMQEVHDDISQQLEYLFRKGFVNKAGLTWLPQYPRYFKALEKRIERLRNSPVIKDLAKLERLTPFMNDWFAQLEVSESPTKELVDFGWLLEEFRVSLFAPEVSTSQKISEKRLRKEWEKIAG